MATVKTKGKRKTDYKSLKGYVKGSIMRIKLENFLTYDEVEFAPGPNLNVIIGPNGTGKSSIVCAIALALAGRTQVLGRARDPVDYIKHGCQTGSVELELNNPDGENYVVKRIITRRDKVSRWLVNNRPASMRSIEELAASLNIQVGNLCQFLPQDKVDEFAKMNTIELLESTEKAVGGIDMWQKHMQLKSSRDDMRTRELELTRTREHLEQEVSKNARLENDVKAFQKRQQHLDRINVLEMKRPWIAYEERRRHYEDERARKEQVANDISQHRDMNQPLQELYDQANKELGHVDREIKKKTEDIRSSAQVAADRSRAIENEAEKMDDILQEFENKKAEEAKREKQIRELTEQLRLLEADLGKLDAVDVQPQLQQISGEMRNVSMSLTRVNQEGENLRNDHNELKREIKDIQSEVQKLQDVNNQRLAMLRSKSRDAYTAVQWLRENKAKFNATVHEPIMTVINVTDSSHIKYVESHIGYKDMLAFVCEDPDDQQLLLRTLREEQRLRINVVGTPEQPSHSFKPDTPIADYQRHGFIAYLKDLFTCPEAVMRYLCKMYHVHRIPVGNRHTKNHVQDVITHCKELRTFYTENHRYSVVKSRYSGESSSSCRELREPSLLTKSFDSVRDRQLKRELSQKEGELSDLELNMREVQTKHKHLEGQMTSLRNQKQDLTVKRDLERTLRQKIKSKKQIIAVREGEALNIEDEQSKKDAELRAIVARKTKLLVDMKESTKRSWEMTQEKVTLSLKKLRIVKVFERTQLELREKTHVLNSLKLEYEKMKTATSEKKAEARALLAAAKRATNTEASDELSPELRRAFEEVNANTLDEIERAIHDERARAHMCSTYAADEDVLREYNLRKEKISELEKQVTSQERQLTTHRRDLESVKIQWIDPVNEMISQINEKFSYLFAQMKCAGEVTLNVPENAEDYGQYGVKIKVKYRDNEPLQELTAHLQSGGERSVATVLYMMALQEMTSCPFRCVDEINQGMDPINERKVFELVVNISCKRDTAQYFLLTPKLLPDLSYSAGMTILCVWNGPQMLHHKEWNIKQFLKRRAAMD